MGVMLDFIRNRNDIFKTSQINNATNEEIVMMMRKAFRYTQSILREDYQIDLHKKQEKINKEKKKFNYKMLKKIK